LERNSASTTALVILAVLGSMAAIHLLKAILVPMVLALLLACLLSPFTAILRRFLPLGPIGAAVVPFVLMTMAGLYLATLAAESLVKATTTLPADADQLSRILRDRLVDLSRDMPFLQGVLPEPGTIDLLGDRNRTFLITTLSDRWGDLSGLVIQGLIVLVLALFFLIESEMLAPKLVRFFAHAPGDAHAAERALQDLVHQIRAYLLARTAINIGLGLTFAAALWVLGIRYALAQGALVAVTNYVPYVGQVLGGAIPVLTTVLQGKDFGDALIVASVYIGLLGVEGYVVTPYVLGRSLDLNGTTVLIACLFWGFLWGLVGLVLAMPFAVCMKLVFQHIPSLHRWADLMSYTWVAPGPPKARPMMMTEEVDVVSSLLPNPIVEVPSADFERVPPVTDEPQVAT
jgi:predicted PurR-regulated permease PerM